MCIFLHSWLRLGGGHLFEKHPATQLTEFKLQRSHCLSTAESSILCTGMDSQASQKKRQKHVKHEVHRSMLPLPSHALLLSPSDGGGSSSC